MSSELIAGYASYANTEAIVAEQGSAAVAEPESMPSITFTLTGLTSPW